MANDMIPFIRSFEKADSFDYPVVSHIQHHHSPIHCLRSNFLIVTFFSSKLPEFNNFEL